MGASAVSVASAVKEKFSAFAAFSAAMKEAAIRSTAHGIRTGERRERGERGVIFTAEAAEAAEINRRAPSSDVQSNFEFELTTMGSGSGMQPRLPRIKRWRDGR